MFVLKLLNSNDNVWVGKFEFTDLKKTKVFYFM